jgi:hypothetical protein
MQWKKDKQKSAYEIYVVRQLKKQLASCITDQVFCLNKKVDAFSL